MKTSTIITLAIIGGIGYYAIAGQHDTETQARLDKVCFDKHGANTKGANSYSDTMCTMTDAYEEAQEAIKVAATAKAEQDKVLAEANKAEEKRIKEEKRLAFLASPEGKTETFVGQAHEVCKQHIKASAKFPSKVDFDWGGADKYWMNFSEGKSRVMIQRSGEMMNGFGMMIPFKATCKYDYEPNTNKYSIVEILI
jgi:cation transport ATPase